MKTKKKGDLLAKEHKKNPDFLCDLKCKFWDLSPLFIRLGLAVVFMAHGYAKLTGLGGTASFFGSIGIPAPELMAPFVAGVEFFGGLAMLLGIFTQVSGLLLACTMIVALWTTKISTGQPLGKMELDLAMLAMSLSMVFNCAGKYSLEAMLCKDCKDGECKM